MTGAVKLEPVLDSVVAIRGVNGHVCRKNYVCTPSVILFLSIQSFPVCDLYSSCFRSPPSLNDSCLNKCSIWGFSPGEGDSWKDELLELARSKQERTMSELRCLRQVQYQICLSSQSGTTKSHQVTKPFSRK